MTTPPPPPGHEQATSLNPNNKNSIKTRFTYRFLRALNHLSLLENGSSSSIKSNKIRERGSRVKMAANVSMAAAVGSKRAWSLAILWKNIRNRRQKRMRRHPLILIRPASIKRRKKNTMVGNANKRNSWDIDMVDEARQLRKVIPGGSGMEIGNLLQETAHYINCLTTQVQVMRNILHFSSPN